MTVSYFAYGSNMASQRLLQRLPRAKHMELAILAQHRLNFHKNDRGLSGKCDIELTGRVDDEVVGVIYEISLEDKQILDQIEGLGCGYDEKTVELRTLSGQTIFAVTYFAIDIDRKVYLFRILASYLLDFHTLYRGRYENLHVSGSIT